MASLFRFGLCASVSLVTIGCASQSDLAQLRESPAHSIHFQVEHNIDPVMDKVAQNIWACHVFPIKRRGLPNSELETDHQGYNKFVSYKSTYTYPLDVELEPYDLTTTDVSVRYIDQYAPSAKAVPLWFGNDYLECRTSDELTQARSVLRHQAPKVFTQSTPLPELFEAYSDLMLTCFDSRRDFGPYYMVDTLVSFVSPKGMITGVNYKPIGKPVYGFQLELEALSPTETQVTYYGHPQAQSYFEALMTWTEHPDQDLACPARLPLY
jgi:hypothetical protein